MWNFVKKWIPWNSAKTDRCSFLKHFHTKKLSEISIFYAVLIFTNFITCKGQFWKHWYLIISSFKKVLHIHQYRIYHIYILYIIEYFIILLYYLLLLLYYIIILLLYYYYRICDIYYILYIYIYTYKHTYIHTYIHT